MKRYLVLTKVMFLMQVRNRAMLFWNLAFPIFLLLIYSAIFGHNHVSGVNYMTWVIPGVIVFNILAYGLLSSSTVMVELRQKGVLRRLQASPVPARHLVCSYLTVNILVCTLQAILILTFSVLFFSTNLTLSSALLAFPVVVVAVITCVALGQMISGVAPTVGVAVIIGQIANFSQMFITDMIMPIEMMPDWLQKVAPYLPAYAVVQLVRPPLVSGRFGPELGPNLLVACIYALVAGLLAAVLFRWAPKE
jgi:ABC-2 type transport system permease protein